MTETTIEENVPTCDEVLEQAKGKLESVLLIGIGKDGEEGYYAGTTSDVDKIIKMTETFKEYILENEKK